MIYLLIGGAFVGGLLAGLALGFWAAEWTRDVLSALDTEKGRGK